MTPSTAWQWFREMGGLRNALQILAICFILVLPFSEPSRILEGFALVTGGIIPATAPLVFIVMMFDVLMANVMKGERDEHHARIMARVIRSNVTIGGVLIFLWLWSFRAVLLP